MNHRFYSIENFHKLGIHLKLSHSILFPPPELRASRKRTHERAHGCTSVEDKCTSVLCPLHGDPRDTSIDQTRCDAKLDGVRCELDIYHDKKHKATGLVIETPMGTRQSKIEWNDDASDPLIAGSRTIHSETAASAWKRMDFHSQVVHTRECLEAIAEALGEDDSPAGEEDVLPLFERVAHFLRAYAASLEEVRDANTKTTPQ